MGGAAFIVYGKRITPEKKDSFLKKILGKKEDSEKVSESVVRELQSSLVEYIETSIKVKSISTIAVINYIKEIRNISCYIRKTENREYFQMGYSGCAGMTEVSAEVAVHWAEKWFTYKKDKIEEIIKNEGFLISSECESHEAYFVPAGEAGYALSVLNIDSKKAYAPGNIFLTDIFEVDNYVYEIMPEEKYVEMMKEINLKYRDAVINKKCLCDICISETDY